MPEKLKFIVTGRTASGKKTLISELRKAGFKIAEIYATNNEYCNDKNINSYRFVSSQDILDLKNDGIVLNTETDDCHYFTTKKQILECDIVMLDPLQIYKISEEFPDINFRLLYINPVNRALFPADSNFIFEYNAHRLKQNKEHERFQEFERNLWNGKLHIENIRNFRIIGNDYTDTSDIFCTAEILKTDILVAERTKNILETMIENQLLSYDDEDVYVENKTICVNNDSKYNCKFWKNCNECRYKDGDTYTCRFSTDMFTEIMISNPETFSYIMKKFLSTKNKKIFSNLS